MSNINNVQDEFLSRTQREERRKILMYRYTNLNFVLFVFLIINFSPDTGLIFIYLLNSFLCFSLYPPLFLVRSYHNISWYLRTLWLLIKRLSSFIIDKSSAFLRKFYFNGHEKFEIYRKSSLKFKFALKIQIQILKLKNPLKI